MYVLECLLLVVQPPWETVLWFLVLCFDFFLETIEDKMRPLTFHTGCGPITAAAATFALVLVIVFEQDQNFHHQLLLPANQCALMRVQGGSPSG